MFHDPIYNLFTTADHEHPYHRGTFRTLEGAQAGAAELKPKSELVWHKYDSEGTWYATIDKWEDFMIEVSELGG